MIRIRLISVKDAYTNLKAGDEGTVVRESFDQIGVERHARFDVQWDNGSTLAIYPHLDKFEILSVGTSVITENM